jgi:hypothetical protein
MKRIFCFCLAFLICFCLFGCENRYETVSLGEEEYIYGEIVEKILPDILVLAPNVKMWGETVHVVSDEVDKWCVGDEIGIKFSEVHRPSDKSKCVRIIANDIHSYAMDYKPILYFYTDSSIKCSVRVILDGELTCTYPEHGADGWNEFTVCPDGTLIFPDGKEYYALYWEGVQNTKWDFSEGFCVRGEDTAKFLEWALAEQGLTAREANEFIIYWLPRMQENPYNVISFQTTAYTDGAVLDIAPAPDSLLRVFMAYYPSDAEVEIEPQEFCGFVREGFTVVEWGGDQAKKP